MSNDDMFLEANLYKVKLNCNDDMEVEIYVIVHSTVSDDTAGLKKAIDIAMQYSNFIYSIEVVYSEARLELGTIKARKWKG